MSIKFSGLSINLPFASVSIEPNSDKEKWVHGLVALLSSKRIIRFSFDRDIRLPWKIDAEYCALSVLEIKNYIASMLQLKYPKEVELALRNMLDNCNRYLEEDAVLRYSDVGPGEDEDSKRDLFLADVAQFKDSMMSDYGILAKKYRIDSDFESSIFCPINMPGSAIRGIPTDSSMSGK